MKRICAWLLALLLCMAAVSAAAEDIVWQETDGRITGEFTGPVIESLTLDMPVPQDVPDPCMFVTQDIRITQRDLEEALSGLIDEDHAYSFNIDPGKTYSNYVFNDEACEVATDYFGEPKISQRADKAFELEQAKKTVDTFLNRLNVDYQLYFVGRVEDLFSPRYPISDVEAGHWEVTTAREELEKDKYTIIVALYDIGGLPLGTMFYPNPRAKDGYDYGGAVYMVVDDTGKIRFAQLSNPKRYAKDADSEAEIIPWQTALETAICRRTQTPIHAKSARNYVTTFTDMRLCVFSTTDGKTYPVWRVMENCFYEAKDFKGNDETRGGYAWMYIDAITGAVVYD
ncbi:MAG: hypothetical protein Q4G52_09465 [Clostridia bacterium]|nr:hypothetical protein [Clostridia bacterium]